MAGRIFDSDIKRIQAPLRAELAEVRAERDQYLSILAALVDQSTQLFTDDNGQEKSLCDDNDEMLYIVPHQVVHDADEAVETAKRKEEARQAKEQKGLDDFIKKLPRR